ncbi:MAG: murein biosynthesis integral membrane protein MurJ [Chloroflexales bacterium]|nr:murein biosynthesis integral membrane protein MurJ [Chloroflexales bacterium]
MDTSATINRGKWRAGIWAALTREYSVAAGAALWMVAFGISAALGIVRQVLFNAEFGAGAEASAYYAAFRLPDTITTLVAGGTLANAFIPVLLATERIAGSAAARRLTNLVLTALLATLLCATVVGIAAAPLFVTHVLAPGFDAPTSRLTASLARLMLLELVPVAFTSVASAVLLSHNRCLLPTIAIAAHNLSLISSIVLVRFYPSLGVYGPTLGAAGESLLQLAILLPGLRAVGFRFRPAWNPRDRDLREVVRLLIPNGLSGLVNYAGAIVDTSFASRAGTLAGIPALQNAFLLIGLPVRLLGIAIGQAAFPRLAGQGAAHDWAGMRSTLLRTLGAALALALVALAGLVLLGRPVIALLFERGRFTVANGDLTYVLLVAYAAALPAYIGTELVTRGLIALHDTRTPLITNCLQLAGRVALIPLLIGTVGVLAIPIAFAATSALETVALALVLFRKLRRKQPPPVI